MIIRPRRIVTARAHSHKTDPTSTDLPKTGKALQTTTSPSSLGRILRVDEIAELFHKSREMVKRELRERKLPGFKFGRSWYVREADLDRHFRREEEQ
jgi:excisionase family DNA binding protein